MQNSTSPLGPISKVKLDEHEKYSKNDDKGLEEVSFLTNDGNSTNEYIEDEDEQLT